MRLTKTALTGAAAWATVALTPLTEGATNIDAVFVGNAGNSKDSNNYGAVTYDYYIGKYEITQGQWTAFLNTVATDKSASGDILNLYNGSMNEAGFAGITRVDSGGSYSYSVDPNYAKRPVNYVSVSDAKRFCNWLTNQMLHGTSDTENGIYSLVAGANAVRVDAVWQQGGVSLPDDNEWYKAAYYDPNKGGAGVGGYYTYSTTGSGNTGGSDVMSTSYANHKLVNDLVYHDTSGPGWGNGTYYLNEVDFYEDYKSAYGAVDMTGNVWEWTDNQFNAGNRVVRGGGYDVVATSLSSASSRIDVPVGYERKFLSFRVASLALAPEIHWTGGNGTWDATSVNWSKIDASSGPSAAFGPVHFGEKIAVFDGSAAVDVSGTHYVDGVWVKSGTVALRPEAVGGGTLHFVDAGSVVVEAGASLRMNAALIDGVTGILKEGGGELLLGSGTIANLVTVGAGTFGVISDGGPTSTLTLASGLDMASVSTLKVVLGGDGTETRLDLNGVASTLDGVTLEVEGSGVLVIAGVHVSNYADVNAWASAVGLAPQVGTWNDGTYVSTIAAIPEPSTYALFGATGALALALLRRRRKA